MSQRQDTYVSPATHTHTQNKKQQKQAHGHCAAITMLSWLGGQAERQQTSRDTHFCSAGQQPLRCDIGRSLATCDSAVGGDGDSDGVNDGNANTPCRTSPDRSCQQRPSGVNLASLAPGGGGTCGFFFTTTYRSPITMIVFSIITRKGSRGR